MFLGIYPFLLGFPICWPILVLGSFSYTSYFFGISCKVCPTSFYKISRFMYVFYFLFLCTKEASPYCLRLYFLLSISCTSLLRDLPHFLFQLMGLRNVTVP